MLNRISRHLLFCGLFGLGFYVQSIGDGPNKFFYAFISLLVFFPVCLVVSYISLYVSLPRFLHHKKYGAFIIISLLLLLGALFINYFMSLIYYSFSCECIVSLIPFYKVFGLAFINTTHAVIIGGFVLGIKISKNWYLQYKDNQEMARQKTLHELQLQRSRIYPGFIFHSMQKLYDKINEDSPEAPGMLLKLSELLSYILYESDEKLVTVEQELDIMQHLIELEKINQPGNIHCSVTTTTDIQQLYMRPMSLFTFLLNCFSAANEGTDKQPYHFNVQVHTDPHQVNMLFTAEQLVPHITAPADWNHVLQKTRQEWDMLQADHYHLSIVSSNGSTQIQLSLQLATVTEAMKHEVIIETGMYEFA